MEFGGRYLFSAPRDRVWAALNDTAVLKAAIPGCSRLDWTGTSTLECEIKVNLGVMQPTFTGDLELRDVVPAERYTLAGPDADTRRAELLRIEGVMYPASLGSQPKQGECGSSRHGLLAPSRQADT